MANSFGYAPKRARNGKLPFVHKLSNEDKKHMAQWRAAGFTVETIARAYGVSKAYAAYIVRMQAARS